jgi:mRNA interferase MazF
MRRGDVVVVALSGDYGKPRPAVVVQSDSVLTPVSVFVCPLTTSVEPSDVLRIVVAPSEANGLREPSQLMVDKTSPTRRDRCGPVIGRIDDATMAELDGRLAFVLGLADGAP